MAPYKHDCGEKKLSHSARQENAIYKMTVAKKTEPNS
jgi:hypothetical protein